MFKKDPSGTKDVWFYDMQADGHTLDDKRTPIDDNDIPDIIARFKSINILPLEGKVSATSTDEVESIPFDESKRERTEKSFFVGKDEIVSNDYDLSINKYKKTEYVPIEYPSTEEIMANIRELEIEIGSAMDELEKMLGLN